MAQTAFHRIEATPEETSLRLRSVTQFETLAIPHVDALYNFARWLVKSDGDAEGLVQETYLRALWSFGSFQLDTNFRAWLFRILHNTFLTSSKRLPTGSWDSPDSEVGGPDLTVENEPPETILIKHLNSEQIQRALDALPDVYRETILFCDVENLSYCEISEALSIPIGTVMSRLTRGRKAIRNHFEAH